ncbi:hypothetical protein HJFPF1_04691 [Paramyrothecium foliicola]|nr:hypothetical protein HJFPF1_04691 [Paramyrothecium foliicola]
MNHKSEALIPLDPNSFQVLRKLPSINMLFNKAILLLTTMAANALGLAVPVLQQNIDTHDDVSSRMALVTMQDFESSNYGGSSRKFEVETQTQCYRLEESGWDNRMSSIKVPQGFRCRLWDSKNYNGDSTLDIYPPGATGLGGMNDKAASFKCYLN